MGGCINLGVLLWGPDMGDAIILGLLDCWNLLNHDFGLYVWTVMVLRSRGGAQSRANVIKAIRA